MSGPEDGNCYEAAYDAMTICEESGVCPSVLLVHGVVAGRGELEGQRFKHAWVEVSVPPNVVVIDHSNGVRITIQREDYYRIGEVIEEECRRYNRAQAIILLMKMRHLGPWDEALEPMEAELKEFCNWRCRDV